MAASKLRKEIREIREEVLDYKPGKASSCPERVVFPENLYIGIFGQIGCGTTSLINSLKFAAHRRLRRVKRLQTATQEKAGGHTMFRRLADITKTIFVIDNRGLDEPNTEKALTELRAQLDGKRGYRFKVAWQGGKDEDELGTTDLDMDQPQSEQSIGCAVFVFSARHDIDSNTTRLTEVVDFLHAHEGQVIAHVDVAEKDYVKTPRSLTHAWGIRDTFEVANVTDGKAKLEGRFQLSLLNLIERCRMAGDDTLIFKYHQNLEEKRKEGSKKKQKKKRARELEQRLREKGRKANAKGRTAKNYPFN